MKKLLTIFMVATFTPNLYATKQNGLNDFTNQAHAEHEAYRQYFREQNQDEGILAYSGKRLVKVKPDWDPVVVTHWDQEDSSMPQKQVQKHGKKFWKHKNSSEKLVQKKRLKNKAVSFEKQY